MHKRRFFTLLGSSAVAFASGAFAEEDSLLLASRAEAEAAKVPSDVLLLQVLRDGVLYRYVRDAEGTALTTGDGSRWSPAETPSLLHWGVAADGKTDDAGPMTAFIEYLDRAGREGHVPGGTYAVSHVICRDLQRGLVLRCHPEAWILGLAMTETLPELGGDRHEITAFPVTARGVQVTVGEGRQARRLTEGRDFELSGRDIRWAPTMTGRAAGQETAPRGPVRIVSAEPMIQLGPGRGAGGVRCDWQGGVIDNSRRGFVQARASGSGLSLHGFETYAVTGASFQGAADYRSAQRAGVTDTGLTVVRASGGMISGNRFSGQADAGIYITGGNDPGPGDNGVHHLVQGNHFVGCNVGTTAKRDARGVKIVANTFENCFVGASFYNTRPLGKAARGTISGNTFIRCERRAIDLRTTRAVIVADNVIRDVGGAPRDDADGAVPGWEAIGLRGVRDALVTDNLLTFEEHEGAGRVGILLTADSMTEEVDCARVQVHGNTIFGFATGIRERGNGADNVYRENVILEAARPMDVPAGRTWQYRDAERAYEGTG